MAPLSCQDKGHRAKINNYNQLKEPGWKVEFFFKAYSEYFSEWKKEIFDKFS